MGLLQKLFRSNAPSEYLPGTLIDHSHGFILFYNAKCGSGSAKIWYLSTTGVLPDQTEHRKDPDKSLGMSVHDHVRLNQDKYSATKDDLIKHSDYKKIILARNPWRRLASFYCDKILKPENRLNRLNMCSEGQYPNSMTFREFIEQINTIPTECLEGHLQNQTYGRSHLLFDQIIRLENLQSDTKQVSQMLGISKSFSFPRRNKTVYGSQEQKYVSDQRPDQFSIPPPYTCFYDENIIDIVAKKYADDIKLFGYGFLD